MLWEPKVSARHHEALKLRLDSQTNLFGSHRYYIWAYEKALRDECGYTGYPPYMNYNRLVNDPKKSAMFNGNATSMSGDGVLTSTTAYPRASPHRTRSSPLPRVVAASRRGSTPSPWRP